MAKAKSAIPEGFQTVTPVATFDNAAQAIEWYKKALGAEEISRFNGPDGAIMHAELKIGTSRMMLNDAVMGARGPREIGGSPVAFWIYVDDCDALFNRALSAGATVYCGDMGTMRDQFWGDRTGTLTDPHGYNWTIATRKEDLSRDEMEVRGREFMKNFVAQTAHK